MHVRSLNHTVQQVQHSTVGASQHIMFGIHGTRCRCMNGIGTPTWHIRSSTSGQTHVWGDGVGLLAHNCQHCTDRPEPRLTGCICSAGCNCWGPYTSRAGSCASTYLLVYECCNWQAVEAVCEGPPEPDAVPPLALIIEPIDPVDGCALVVASQEEEVLGVLDLRAVAKSICCHSFRACKHC